MIDMKKLKKLLPKPAGYYLLVALPPEKEKIGSVHITKDMAARENVASITANVIAVGPDAYNDPIKFPSGPWCRESDWILFKSYSGSRFKLEGQEFRLISDDTVMAVVDDPRLVERA